MADRRPAEMLVRNGLLKVGAELGDRRSTAGLAIRAKVTQTSQLTRFHAIFISTLYIPFVN